MPMLEEFTVTCPYCWSDFEATVDCSGGDQDYVEDCPVCCSPIQLRAYVDMDGALADLEALRDDE